MKIFCNGCDGIRIESKRLDYFGPVASLPDGKWASDEVRSEPPGHILVTCNSFSFIKATLPL